MAGDFFPLPLSPSSQFAMSMCKDDVTADVTVLYTVFYCVAIVFVASESSARFQRAPGAMGAEA